MTAAPYEAVEGWEQLPDGYRHLDVADVAVDEADNVYLLTRLDPRVIVYDRDGKFLRSWGEGVFGNRPHGITVGPDGTVYCVDEGEHIVRRFDAEGGELSVIGIPGQPSDTGHDRAQPTAYLRAASTARAAGPFHRPTKLAVGPEGELYVSDGYGNCRVHHFTPDGELVGSWGEPGTGPGEFHVPHSLLVLDDGRILVADRENDRIQVFSAEGAFLEIWDDIQRPTSLGVDAEGLIYVSELPWWPGERSWVYGDIYRQKPGRLSVLDSGGRVVARWTSEGDGRGPGCFLAPHGLAVDSNGDIYVGETAYTYVKGQGIEEPTVNSFHKFARTRRL